MLSFQNGWKHKHLCDDFHLWLCINLSCTILGSRIIPYPPSSSLVFHDRPHTKQNWQVNTHITSIFNYNGAYRWFKSCYCYIKPTSVELFTKFQWKLTSYYCMHIKEYDTGGEEEWICEYSSLYPLRDCFYLIFVCVYMHWCRLAYLVVKYASDPLCK